MAIALEYKQILAWRTLAKNVRLLQKATDENPAMYRLKVSPIDRHEIGAGTVDDECYFISYMGNPYTVTDATPEYIDVRDDFRVGVAPTSSKTGIVYKGVDGSPFIAPIFYRYLHNTAMENMRKIELSILWQYSQLLNCKWNPKGLLFSFDTATNNLSHTAGELNVSNWYAQRPEKRVDLDTVTIDPTPVNKPFSVAANVYPIADPDAYYIYALFPLDKLANNCIFRVNKEYWREKMFNGYITVLFGILNSESDGRTIVLNWSVIGQSGLDEKVKFDSLDPTPGYLNEKIIAGTNITISEGTGVDENKLKISSSGGTSAPTTVSSSSENNDNGTNHTHALDNAATNVGTFQFATVVIDAKGRVTSASTGTIPSSPAFQVGANAIVSATGAVSLATNIPVSYTRVLFRVTWSLRNDTDIWEDLGEVIFASGGSVAKSNMKQVIVSDHSMTITVESDGGSPAKWNFKVTPPGGTFGFNGYLIMSIENIYQFS